MAKATCSIEDCDRPARARGWCEMHYDRWKAHGDPLTVLPRGRPKVNLVCTVSSCDKPATRKYFCEAHYRRNKTGKPMDVVLRPRRSNQLVCEVEGCGRSCRAGGLCTMHWQRKRKTGEVGPPGRITTAPGLGYVNPDGYKIFSRNGRNIPEHREVMEGLIGRSLYPEETVHHKNGIRHDNRAANLELWVVPQPYGQRVEDLVGWVVEHYPDLVREALEERN